MKFLRWAVSLSLRNANARHRRARHVGRHEDRQVAGGGGGGGARCQGAKVPGCLGGKVHGARVPFQCQLVLSWWWVRERG